MSFGMKPVKLAIQHVGKPREGVPVADVVERKRPDKTLFAQARSHRRVFRDIARVIQVNEFEGLHLPVDQKGQEYQNDAYQAGQLASEVILPRWFLVVAALSMPEQIGLLI
jgi:hypothetical protein